MQRPAITVDSFQTHPDLIDHICDTIHRAIPPTGEFFSPPDEKIGVSAVLLLLGPGVHGNGAGPEPCVILNKRSLKVRQPGDICCPGGGVEPRLDGRLTHLMNMPVSPLGRWPYWKVWRRSHPDQARRLSLLFTTGLREGFEEMRLSPIGVRFLGPLSPQQLILFHRVIYPMVGWVTRQKRFFPNWEVEKVVHVPLGNLLRPENYACYRLAFPPPPDVKAPGGTQDFPCFLHRAGNESELIWGATFRILATFLKTVFRFEPPKIESLPVVDGTMDRTYFTGRR